MKYCTKEDYFCYMSTNFTLNLSKNKNKRSFVSKVFVYLKTLYERIGLAILLVFLVLLLFFSSALYEIENKIRDMKDLFLDKFFR